MLHRNMRWGGAYSIPNVRDLPKGAINLWSKPAVGAAQSGQ
jgi:hypothetical protein